MSLTFPAPNTDSEEVFIHTFSDSARIISCPEVTVVDSEHTIMRRISSSVYRILCKRVHSQCADVTFSVIWKQNSMSSDMDTTDHPESRIGRVPVVVSCRVRYPTALVPQLQL
jgi:hypothetical protein